MAGITHLNEIYKKKGKDFINKLFDSYVTINEKLDASAFAVERNPVTKELEFFKRNTNAPISMIDRTLMRLYEKPIAHINSLGQDVLSKIPSGWRIGMEYFVNEHPQELSYDRTPKNGLVLSYIHVKNALGKIVRTIQSKEELDKWADVLQIEKPPIIFQGVLNNEQKIKIMDFLDTPHEDLTKKFKTESFVKYIITILNPKLKRTMLNADLEKPIEGVVFRFGEDDGDVVLAKLVDPVFSQLSKDKVNEGDDNPNDIYYLTLIDLMNYIEGSNFKKLKPKGRTFEERYINFICQLFLSFINDKGDEYKDLDFYEPEFMKKKEFDLNREFINNQTVLEVIDSNDSYKKLFKIMLASFRKRRKKASGVFTQEVIRQFNGTIDKVTNHLSQDLRESEVPLFSEFIAQRGRNLDIEETEEETEELPPVEDTVGSFKNKMDLLASEEPTTEPPKKPTKKKGKKVNIIVGRFQPFHNGHLNMAKELHAANKLPVVVIAVHPGHNKSGSSPFTMPTLRTMLGNLQQDSEGIIIGYRIIGRGFIQDVINALRPEFEPILWGVGPDRLNDYSKQLELNFKRNNELELDDKFEIMETKRMCSGTDVRKSIEEDKFGSFKSSVPKSVQGVYPLLRNDIQRSVEKSEK